MKTGPFRSNCPINQVLEMLGDNWSLLIIRDMLFFNKSSYGEFMQSPENISTNILASRLKQLESHGMIEKWQSKVDRKKYVYVLSQKGIDLWPMLAEMMLWAVDNSPAAPALPDQFIAALQANRDGTLKPLIQEYKTRKQALLADSQRP